jgi:hypothetical protein
VFLCLFWVLHPTFFLQAREDFTHVSCFKAQMPVLAHPPFAGARMISASWATTAALKFAPRPNLPSVSVLALHPYRRVICIPAHE